MRVKDWADDLRRAGLEVDSRLITEYSDLKSVDDLSVVWSPWPLDRTLFYLDSFYSLSPRRPTFGYVCCWSGEHARFIEIHLLVPPTKRQLLQQRRIWLTLRQLDQKQWCSFDLNDPTWSSIEYLKAMRSRSYTSALVTALERHSRLQKHIRYQRLLRLLSSLPTDVLNVVSLFLDLPHTHKFIVAYHHYVPI